MLIYSRQADKDKFLAEVVNISDILSTETTRGGAGACSLFSALQFSVGKSGSPVDIHPSLVHKNERGKTGSGWCAQNARVSGLCLRGPTHHSAWKQGHPCI